MSTVGQKALARPLIVDSTKPVHCDTRALYIIHNLPSIITNIFKENALPRSEID